MDESEELSCTLRAFERVVCEIREVALNGSFVGKYHILLIWSYVPQHFRFYIAISGRTEKASQAKISSKILSRWR